MRTGSRSFGRIDPLLRTHQTPAVLERIVSGGQTGADRAALDAAIAVGFSHGGWCPKGRRAEDGPIHSRYQLHETESDHYIARTEMNVQDSDGTLILTLGPLTGGSLRTQEFAEAHGRPCLHLEIRDRGEDEAVEMIQAFVEQHEIGTLNVAGPRTSTCPAIYDRARAVMDAFLKQRVE